MALGFLHLAGQQKSLEKHPETLPFEFEAVLVASGILFLISPGRAQDGSGKECQRCGTYCADAERYETFDVNAERPGLTVCDLLRLCRSVRMTCCTYARQCETVCT